MIVVVVARNREWVAVGQSTASDISEATHVRDRRLRLGLARSTNRARDRRPRLPFHPRPSSFDLFLRCALHTLPTRLPSTLFDLDALARVRQARAEIDLLVTAEEFCLGVGIPTIIRLSTQEGTAGALPFRDFRGRAAQFATTSPVLLQSYTRCEG